MAKPINIEDFDKYIRQGEPDKKEKASQRLTNTTSGWYGKTKLRKSK